MKRVAQALLPLIILAAGVGTAMTFAATGPQAAPKEQEEALTFVQVVDASAQTYTPTLRAMGIVQAERSVALAPEVAGRVKEQNAALVPGGLLAQGEPLLRVDARDYSDALAMTKAELAAAQLRVREENTLRQVAEHEWRNRPDGFSDETLAFALREPHLDVAKAQVKSARTRIAKAKRDLGRTLLRAPFDAVVLTESVDVGQSVSPAVPVVTLAGTGRFRVAVSLPVAQLQQLRIPGVNAAAEAGSPAKVFNEATGTNDAFDGAVLRLESAVDQRGRMAQIHIAVDDPMSLDRPEAERTLPLLIGTSVRVELQGTPLSDVIVLPRTAQQEDGSVWVLDGNDALQKRTIEVAWRDAGTLVVRDGVNTGDRVVTTRLPLATEGLRVSLGEAPTEGAGE